MAESLIEELRSLNSDLYTIINISEMRFIIFVCFLLPGIVTAQSIRLPQDIRMDTMPQGFVDGLVRHHFYKNNNVIAIIQPVKWHNNDSKGLAIATEWEASMMIGPVKADTFNTALKAQRWIVTEIENYLMPVTILKWKFLRAQPPKIRIRYPWDWEYRLDRYNSIFRSKAQTNNRLVLLKKEYNGSSEIFQIIRTPNTGKITVEDVIKMSTQMNRMIDLQRYPLKDVQVGGKNFKYTEHYFMEQMFQQHFWYADAEEIIYIGVGLMREDKVRYPEIIKEIIQSIKW